MAFAAHFHLSRLMQCVSAPICCSHPLWNNDFEDSSSTTIYAEIGQAPPIRARDNSFVEDWENDTKFFPQRNKATDLLNILLKRDNYVCWG